MFVVMGATGQTGGAVLDTLRQRGVRARAISRDPARAARLAGKDVEIVRGDSADADSMAAAFVGAEAAYVMLVPPLQAADVLAQSRAAAQAIAGALRAARVPHVVALSSAGAHLAAGNGMVRTLHDFEQALAGAAPSLTFLRAGDFMENWAAMLSVAREAGALPSAKLPLDAKSETVSALDVGRTAAALLFEPRPGTRIVNLAGPAEYSAVDAAALLSKLLGKPVTAVPSPRAEVIAGLQAAGAGIDYAEKLADLYDAINAGRMGFPPGSGEMRRGSVTLEDVLRRLCEGTRP
jgi:NAD(P)H dehydrogenase (quinone)